MELLDAWNYYKDETVFNYSVLPDEIKNKGETFIFEPKQQIITGGDFPRYIYFILSGTAAGIREYVDGNEYRYFQLDATNGCIGLLELLARKDQYIATIISLTSVTVVRMDSAIVYAAILSEISLLRRCTSLLAQDLYQRSGNDGLFYYFQGIDRVRFYLVTYYEEHRTEQQTSDKVFVEVQYQDIAKRIGVSVRTVGRNLQKLKENKEITSWKKKIFISKKQYRMMMDHIYA